jgi:hypothetical protein
MAPLRPPVPAGRAETDFAALAELWLAGRNARHDPGCGCGGMMVPAPDPRAIEDDLLAYLDTRYESEGRTDLAASIERRIQAHAENGSAPPFETWLVGLANEPLGPDDRTRLIADLHRFLESLAGASRRIPGVCY